MKEKVEEKKKQQQEDAKVSARDRKRKQRANTKQREIVLGIRNTGQLS